MNRLQMVLNAAARLLTSSSRITYITLIPSSIHWLPIKLRFDFKVLVLTYRALHSQAPVYISDLHHPYTISRSLGPGPSRVWGKRWSSMWVSGFKTGECPFLRLTFLYLCWCILKSSWRPIYLNWPLSLIMLCYNFFLLFSPFYWCYSL